MHPCVDIGVDGSDWEVGKYALINAMEGGISDGLGIVWHDGCGTSEPSQS